MARSGREVPEGPRLPNGTERSSRATEDTVEEQEQTKATRYSEYFVLETSAGSWSISRRMAEFIESELDRWPRRRWIRFIDLTGATVRVRLELIRVLRQSSPDIRNEWRRFKEERKREEPPDEPWDWEIDL